AEGHTTLAVFLEMNGQSEEAFEHNQYVLQQIDANDLKALCGTALWYDKKGQRSEACQLSQRIFKLSEDAAKELCHDSSCASRIKYAREYAANIAHHLKKNCPHSKT